MNKKMSTSAIIRLPPYKVLKVVQTLSQTEGWGIRQLSVPDAWKVTEGGGETAMIIDTGFTNHIDLLSATVLEKSRDFIGEGLTDKNGHSTHCCGIIGARNNDIGMVGVAPQCNIITCKVLNEDGTGSYNAIIDALKYAVEVKPTVISMSLGGPIDDFKIHDLIKELYNMNIPVIAAAGNEGPKDNTMGYPGMYPEVISVGAFDREGNIADFSSRGPNLDFAAPGVNIYSTWLNNSYAILDGTSMATPFMAGVVLLLMAKHKKQEAETGQNDCKTVPQIMQHLIKYADDKGVLGKDDVWGYGVIDIDKMIADTTNGGPATPTTTTLTTTPKPKKSWKQWLTDLINKFRSILGK